MLPPKVLPGLGRGQDPELEMLHRHHWMSVMLQAMLRVHGDVRCGSPLRNLFCPLSKVNGSTTKKSAGLKLTVSWKSLNSLRPGGFSYWPCRRVSKNRTHQCQSVQRQKISSKRRPRKNAEKARRRRIFRKKWKDPRGGGGGGLKFSTATPGGRYSCNICIVFVLYFVFIYTLTMTLNASKRGFIAYFL